MFYYMQCSYESVKWGIAILSFVKSFVKALLEMKTPHKIRYGWLS